MYKINSGLFIKIMLCIAMAFVQGCSDKKSSNNKYIASRRAPESNPMVDDVQKAKMMALKEKSSVKREKDEYDSYQDYQSNEAPVSLKDIKRIKRRPVLNIQELNELMDSKSKVGYRKKSKSRRNEEVNSSEKPCTEANCNLKKVITYNKQQAKKTNTTVPVVPAPKNVAPVAQNPSAPMPMKVMPKIVVPVPAPKNASPVNPAPSTAMQVIPKVVVPVPAPKNASPVNPAPSTAMQVMPKVVVPAAPKNASPVNPAPSTVMQVMPKVVVPAPAPKNASPVNPAPSTAMQVMPKVNSPSSIMVPDLPKVVSPTVETFSGNEPAAPPMAKFTESQSKNKIGTVSTLLIKFYFNIKNKVQNLFIGSE